MNDLPDRETKLTNFLRQNRSIAQPGTPDLEDRLMLELDLLPIETRPRISHFWQRYLICGIGLIVAGISGVSIFQLINPPEPTIAELDRLNLFLEAHAPNLTNRYEPDSINQEDLGDLDPELF
jgi:hypothetical protein